VLIPWVRWGNVQPMASASIALETRSVFAGFRGQDPFQTLPPGGIIGAAGAGVRLGRFGLIGGMTAARHRRSGGFGEVMVWAPGPFFVALSRASVGGWGFSLGAVGAMLR
jgi:hypothetical protein